MKLLVMSDLHAEFAPFAPDERAVAEADVVVLAGDIHHASSANRWARRAFPTKPIILIAGNHEFYGGHWDESLCILRGEAQREGVVFLEDDEIVLDGVRFLGCTLWTDFCYFGTGKRQGRAMSDYARGLNDCRLISAGVVHDCVARVAARQVTPDDVLARHNASRAWLLANLAKPWAGRTAVITHHLPSGRSVANRFKDDRFTPGFASNLPDAFLTSADLWIHGHTHDSCDYVIDSPDGSVRVVCNPRGYPRAFGPENAAFDPALLLEV